MMPIIVAALIAAAAFFVRGFTGFGSTLVMLPLLLFFFDLQIAVPATAMLGVLTGFWITLQARPYVHRSYLQMLVLVAVPGLLVGSLVLANADSVALKRVAGVATVFFALRMALAVRDTKKVRTSWPAGVGYVAGATSGIFGGLFGTSGPPVLVYLENQLAARDMLRATVLTYIFVVDGVRLATYVVSDIVTWDVLQISLAMFPASLAGAYLGTRLQVKTNERLFRLVVSLLLLVTGVLLAVGR